MFVKIEKRSRPYRTFTAGLVYLTGNLDSADSIWHPFGRHAVPVYSYYLIKFLYENDDEH